MPAFYIDKAQPGSSASALEPDDPGWLYRCKKLAWDYLLVFFTLVAVEVFKKVLYSKGCQRAAVGFPLRFCPAMFDGHFSFLPDRCGTSTLLLQHRKWQDILRISLFCFTHPLTSGMAI